MTKKQALLKERRKLLREVINTPDTLENEQRLDYLYLCLDSIREQLNELEEAER